VRAMVIHAEYRRVVAPEPLRSEAGAGAEFSQLLLDGFPLRRD